jgi:hypothetical protein
MNEALGSYRRWRDADESGRDDDADWAFRSVYQATMSDQPVSAGFTTQTMAAVQAATDRDARRARRTRRAALSGTVVGGSVAAYFGAGWAISAVSTVFVAALNLLITAIVGGASAVDRGVDFWAVLSSLGRAAAAFVADPKVTFAMLVIQGIAIVALVVLQRLLGSNGEPLE